MVRKQRKNLQQSLEDLDSTVKAVDTFLTVFIIIALMLLLLIVFSQGDFAQVAVTSSTSVFALSFIFAETAKNFFNSFVFLFLRHPFDVGDRIHINAATNDPYFVLKMELLTTTFKMWSGIVAQLCRHQPFLPPLAFTFAVQTCRVQFRYKSDKWYWLVSLILLISCL